MKYPVANFSPCLYPFTGCQNKLVYFDSQHGFDIFVGCVSEQALCLDIWLCLTHKYLARYHLPGKIDTLKYVNRNTLSYFGTLRLGLIIFYLQPGNVSIHCQQSSEIFVTSDSELVVHVYVWLRWTHYIYIGYIGLATTRQEKIAELLSVNGYYS